MNVQIGQKLILNQPQLINLSQHKNDYILVLFADTELKFMMEVSRDILHTYL